LSKQAASESRTPLKNSAISNPLNLRLPSINEQLERYVLSLFFRHDLPFRERSTFNAQAAKA
jgi:hypothetical protein